MSTGGSSCRFFCFYSSSGASAPRSLLSEHLVRHHARRPTPRRQQRTATIAMRLLLCLLLQLRAGRAADASKPHMNSGVNPPFASAKPQVSLTGSEETALEAGRAVMRQVTSKDGKGGRALAVQDVAASPDTVWNRILAFPEYPKMVTGVQAQPLPHASRLTRHAAPSRPTSRASRLSPCTRSAADHPRWHFWQECSNYETITHRNGTQTIRTRMKLGVMGVSLEYFIDHTYAPRLGVLTWTLDYSRLSDLIDSVGRSRNTQPQPHPRPRPHPIPVPIANPHANPANPYPSPDPDPSRRWGTGASCRTRARRARRASSTL